MSRQPTNEGYEKMKILASLVFKAVENSIVLLSMSLHFSGQLLATCPEKENLEANIQQYSTETDTLKSSIRKITNGINTGDLTTDERIKKIEERISQQERLHKAESNLKNSRKKLQDCISRNNHKQKELDVSKSEPARIQ